MVDYLKQFGEICTENIDEPDKKSYKETVYLHNFLVDTEDNKTYVIPWGRIEKVKYSIKVKKEFIKGTNFYLLQMKLPSDNNINFSNNDFTITKINNIPIILKAKINYSNLIEATLSI